MLLPILFVSIVSKYVDQDIMLLNLPELYLANAGDDLSLAVIKAATVYSLTSCLE